MADISLIDPYSAQQESIARQRRMAQALQQQAQSPMEMPQTPGVLISPYAGLAKVLQGVYGGYQEAEADKEYRNLVNEARTNQAEDFAKVIGALSAPGREGVAGQAEIPYEPAQIEQIYGTKPAPIKGTGFGSGMLMPDQVIGEKVIKAEVPYQAAIPEVKDVPAGYISPELIANLKDPSMRQFAMAQAMAKLEPKAPISVAPGASLIDARTLKPVFTAPAAAQRPVALGEGQNLYDSNGKLLVTGTPKTATTTPHWEATTQKVNGKDVPGWINLNAADKAASFVAGAKPTETKATEPKWEKGVKIVDGKNVFGWYDLTAPNYEASFKAGAIPPAGDTKLIEVTRGGKVYYENPAIVDVAARQAAAIEKEVVPVKKIRMDITNPDGSTKTILTDETDPRFAEGFATKGPEYASITTVNSQGETVVRQVKIDDPILKTGYVKPLEGFFGQLQALGVPIGDWRNNPALSDMVNRYFVKGVGGSDIEAVAGYDLQKMEVLARLAEQGIKVPQAVLDKLNIKATPGLLGGAQSSSATSGIAKTPPKINDVVVNGDKKFKFKGGDPNQQSNWVEVK